MIDAERLEQVAREELGYLWGDLNTARQNAIRGQWSIQCDGIEDRIKALTALVGPTPWDEIQISLLESGIYQRIHAELGIEVAPDMERVTQVRENSSSRVRRSS
ncbi:hypothetical protein [Streptomyces sp. NPDC048669]|uniref:hypothetical protein n=1 Tax=Streptomyces sp. NPDC048669 TaxID=3155267 RepID=UPI0034477ED4